MNTNQTDFFPVAARLALELECLLLSCKDTAAVSKWWDSAHEALQQFRGASQALERAQADAGPFWHAVVSKSAPVIDKAIRRLDVAEEYADKCRENYPDVTVVPLYTHPSLPAAQGLSDDEITQVWLDHGGSLNGNNFRSFARAILSRAATVAEPSEEAASYKRMFEDAVRSLAAIDEALGIDPDEAGGAEPILQAIEELKAAQQQAEHPHCYAFKTCSSPAVCAKAGHCANTFDVSQQPEHVGQHVGIQQAEPVADYSEVRELLVEAGLSKTDARKAANALFPRVTLSMVQQLRDTQKLLDESTAYFRQQQAELGADEIRYDGLHEYAQANGLDYNELCRVVRAAQSGQRAGVAEDANLLRDAAEKGLDINQQPQLGCVEVWAGKGDDALVFREYYSGHADREAATKCALKRALAAPTQQQEGA